MRWILAILLTLVLIAPQSLKAQSSFGITPTVTGSAANNLVAKATPGRLYRISAANATSTAAFLVVLNLTASPGDGGITPLLCEALPASGSVTMDLQGHPASFSVGVVAVLTSATTCFTKTTGTVTGFISAQVE